MNSYNPKSVLLNKKAQVISGVVTKQAISEPFPIRAEGSRNFVVRIKASGHADTGTISCLLQTAIGTDWEDSKSVTITADGFFVIKLNVQTAGDQTYLPLLANGRVVISQTHADDDVTIDEIFVLQG
jgi:hypothetical protein